MSHFIKKSGELTSEEQRIDKAMDKHQSSVDDEKMVLKGAGVCYLLGFPLALFGGDDSQVSRVGTTLLIIGLVLLFVHAIIGFRSLKRKMTVKELLNPYLKRKALPFYQELTEMFADKPEVHLHLNDDGTITISDKRKREIN